MGVAPTWINSAVDGSARPMPMPGNGIATNNQYHWHLLLYLHLLGLSLRLIQCITLPRLGPGSGCVTFCTHQSFRIEVKFAAKRQRSSSRPSYLDYWPEVSLVQNRKLERLSIPRNHPATTSTSLADFTGNWHSCTNLLLWTYQSRNYHKICKSICLSFTYLTC